MYWNTGEGHSNILQIAVVILENALKGQPNQPYMGSSEKDLFPLA